MSPIGRVFIVLNLVFAALFLGWSAFYLQRAESNLKHFNDEKKSHETTKTTKDNTIAAHVSEINQHKGELARATEQISQLKAQIASKDAENADLKTRLTTFETKITEIAGSTSAVATRLENQDKINKELTEKFLTADKERNDSVSAKGDAEARLADAQMEIKKFEEKVAALNDEVRSKSDENRVLAAWKDYALKKFPGLTAEATPVIEGQVLVVNADQKLVTISVGEANAEVKAGYTFSIHDSRDYKGEVTITDVSDKNAFGNITRTVPGKQIKAGDKATTRFR